MNIFKAFGGRAAIFDGAMGTMLQSAGLKSGEMPETLNYRDPEAVKRVHKAYIAAGADILTTNSFGANGIKMRGSGLDAAETIFRAVKIAREAADEAGRKVLVAADIGPTGKLMAPFGDLEFGQAYEAYAAPAKAAQEAGADFVLIETMSDLYECKAALLAVKENCDLPVAVSVTFDSANRMLLGADAECAAVYLNGLGADAVGVNCGQGPDGMEDAARQLCRYSQAPVFVNANAGMPMLIGGKTFYRETPGKFAGFAKKLLSFGASAFGGCCGTAPEHIKAMKEAVGEQRPARREVYSVPACCTGTRVFRFEKGVTALIGERLNPTGKPALKEALRRRDYAFAAAEAADQREAGADLLDVNAGLPDINETEVLCGLVKAIQAEIDIPLQIDSANPESLAAAARIYNGIPVINSVNGKDESLDSVLPTVKKYGAPAVALLLDENGISDSPEGRLKVAGKIKSRAAEYGIAPERLLFDALTMTVATDAKSGDKTLECIEKLTREGLLTVSGVSNISYGMPGREAINAAFLESARSRGLSAAIINPASETAKLIIKKEYPSPVPFVYDSGAEPETQNTAKRAELTLYDSVFRGISAAARDCAKRELESGKTPLRVIDEIIVPALNALGAGYERRELFLPHLLGGAEAAKAAFAVLNSAMGENAGGNGVKVVMATVQGDIHDIGKNIVVSLLSNYGFGVIDLGKDVPPQKVLESARESGAQIVGLSALMTTTVPAMAETVRLLHAELPGVKVMVGGAVLTQEYANAMGADFYGPDAMAAVKYAQTFIKRK